MKYKKKVEKLAQRRADWQKSIDSVWKNEPTGHKKPGSLSK